MNDFYSIKNTVKCIFIILAMLPFKNLKSQSCINEIDFLLEVFHDEKAMVFFLSYL